MCGRKEERRKKRKSARVSILSHLTHVFCRPVLVAGWLQTNVEKTLIGSSFSFPK